MTYSAHKEGERERERERESSNRQITFFSFESIEFSSDNSNGKQLLKNRNEFSNEQTILLANKKENGCER